MKRRTITTEEYDAERARRQRAYDEARARGIVAAANPATSGAELAECCRACDAAYLAMIAPMPVWIDVT